MANPNKSFDSINLKGESAAPFVKDAVVVPGLSSGDGPIFPVDDYADYFAAVNDALSDLKAASLPTGKLVLSRARNLDITSGKISIPQNSSVTNSYILQGQGESGTWFRIGSGFPDSVAIETATQSGTANEEGQRLENMLLDDGNDVLTKMIDIVDRGRFTLRDMTLRMGANMTHGIHSRQVNAAEDYFWMQNLRVDDVPSGAVGIRTEGNIATLRDGRIDGNNVSGATGWEMAGSGCEVHASDVSGCGIGYDVTGQDNYIASRIEGPGGAASNGFVEIPYRLHGAHGTTIKPLNAPTRQRAYSEVAAANVRWDMPQTYTPATAQFNAAGAAIPSWINQVGTVGLGAGRLRVERSSAGVSRVDLGGNSPIRFSPGERAPYMDAVINAETATGAVTRAGLAEAPGTWDNWVGAYFDPDGTGTWHVRSVEGGTVNSDTDTGISNGIVRIGVFLGKNQFAGVGIQRTNADNSGYVADTRSSQVAEPEPAVEIDSSSSNFRSTRIRNSRVTLQSREI